MPDPNPKDKPEIELSDEKKADTSDQTPDSIEDPFAEADEEEFSLEHLSAAYAQVLKNRTVENQLGSKEDSDPEAVEVDSSAEPVRSAEEVPVLIEPPSDDLVELEADDDAACPISPASILEAILFVGGPKDVNLTSRKIAAVMRDVSPKEVTALAKALNKSYEKENRAYRVLAEKGNLRMELHPDMIPLQNHILGRNRATKLTQQAINVLAIVAYNQPVTREQVDQIRFKSSGSILNQMTKRDLLRLEWSESSPSQRLYRTTERFLDLFGLESIDDLPQSHDVSDIEELAD